MSDRDNRHEPLTPDEDALAKWQALPKNKPSPQAFSPATGGVQFIWWLIGFGVVIVLLVTLLNVIG